MPHTLKVAVVGVGHLGKWHADKYAASAECALLAVVDTNLNLAREIARKHGARAFADYHEILQLVDAVSIVVPTSLHYKIASEFLEAGIHCLIEKPITETGAEAETLIGIARDKGLILQVGHIERFNSVMLGIAEHLQQPQFLESTRLAPFSLRATDVSVVHDLMIHDIDIILDLIDSPIRSISANGIAVISDTIDIANARIEFENRCVANITASRISRKRERKLRIFQKDAYLSIDFQDRVIGVNRKSETDNESGFKEITQQSYQFEDNDALNLEVLDFIRAINTHSRPMVNGEDGKRALETAIAINAEIKQSL
jgi:predicted dehydrogenase